ncbi:hypothetical protein K432DRAFT_430840 [Lepidopterella palustris CBS 459.81]|uniref:Uncharacterized protein n=1 Tax=Lepidopterella palustris CBS 459.81 TaxID=1314670 RepID=A0A8E2DWC0_9PEZI|nr:hypothetical protein K432DRAFT_430840 [Lepidopterella palustris CBS 459.81]
MASPREWAYYGFVLSVFLNMAITFALLLSCSGVGARHLFFVRIDVTHTLNILSPYILPNGTVTTTPDSYYDTPPIEAWRRVFALDKLPDAYRIGIGGFCREYVKPRNNIWGTCWGTTTYNATALSIRAVISHDLAQHNTSAISRETWARLFASAGVASSAHLAKASVALLMTSCFGSFCTCLMTCMTIGKDHKVFSFMLRAYLLTGLLNLAAAIVCWYQFVHWADQSGLKNPAEQGSAMGLCWALAGISLVAGISTLVFSCVIWPPSFGYRRSCESDHEMMARTRPEYYWVSGIGGDGDGWDYGGDGGGDGGD